MKSPLRLRRTTPRPAAALYLPGDAAALLRLCARISASSLPAVHAVAGGFVVRLPAPSEEAWPGAVRLRSLANNLLLPVDANLTPALLDDEAAALTRQRGLVFLPGGRVLAFDPAVALAPADLMTAARLPRRSWQPLPARPDRPDELRELHREDEDPPVEVILDKGGAGIGEEAPRPPGAGVLGTMSGQALTGLGKTLGWLGDSLKWSKLSRLGAELIRKGLEQAPRISESLLGQQEAALRELLRQFREGKTDEALRRALPLGGPLGRGSTIISDARLPFHNLFYRLADLLGSDRGPTGVWMGASIDVQAELAREYRKAAEQATQRGDHRRAAFIYARLLHDWQQAAGALARGGLHHDAAVVYLEKLGDHLAAAQQFERAGEVDRAVELYRQRGEHALAGDLLRRAGEHERAVEEYLLAAEKEAARDNHLAAAELLLSRAMRADLAERFLVAGWERRPQGTSLGCLLRLADLYAERPTHEPLLKLIDEADDFFTKSGNDPQAGRFYNALARLAGLDHLAGLRDDLHDRALTGLAGVLRRRAGDGGRSQAAVSMLFGGGAWDAGLVRDAEVALRRQPAAAKKRPQPQRLLIHRRQVTAACAAGATGEVYLGFTSGAVARFDPRGGDVVHLPRHDGRVLALAVDPHGRWLVALREAGFETFELSSYDLAGVPPPVSRRQTLHGKAAPLLTPIVEGTGRGMIGVVQGMVDLVYFSIPDLQAEGRSCNHIDCRTVHLLDAQFSTLLWEGDRVTLFRRCQEGTPFVSGALELDGDSTLQLPWRLRSPNLPGLPALSWLPPRDGVLEVAGITTSGGIGWAQIRPFTADTEPRDSAQLNTSSFRAVALLGPGHVAGVTDQGVCWVRMNNGRPRQVLQHADVGEVIACFHSPMTNELLMVGPTGDLVRLPIAD
jgi:tetratricopeptide (TPR) repeat protein